MSYIKLLLQVTVLIAVGVIYLFLTDRLNSGSFLD
jgi:hypothetical protein